MIVRLRGTVVSVEAGAVVVDVSGVGYKVYVPSSVAAAVGSEGAEATLYTRMRVSDSDVTLYGAADRDSMQLFDELISVSGIGPRLGMAMLSTFDTAVLANAIATEDTDLLAQTPGVGRKTAQRVVLELKGKVADLALTVGSGALPLPGVAALSDDAVEALISLGYSSGEARRAVAASGVDDDEVLEERLRAALRWLSA